MMMKKKYVRVIIFVFAILFSFVCVLYFFNQTKERLKDTGRNLSIFSEAIDSNDIEQFLVSINNDTISRKTKMALLKDKVKNGWGNNPKILEKIFQEIKRTYIEQWLEESDSLAISGVLQSYLYLFQEICNIVGRNGDPELVDLLLKESSIESWDKSFSDSNAKGMSVEYISDNFFRLYVFEGLLSAAINKPELFEKIESYSTDYLRGTKTNVKDFLINYKEEYYRINPNKIPKEGYIKFTSQMKENPDFFNILFLNLRIQDYVQKHRKLPSTILDLTIPKGGDYVYIPVDQNKEEDNNFYAYRTFRDGNRWMYVLSSVGPNKKLDIHLDRLTVGTESIFHGNPNASQEDIDRAKKIFPELQDEVFSIVTFTINE